MHQPGVKEKYPTGTITRIRNAWLGRVSGCMLGKAVELFSMREGHAALTSYLQQVDALPLRSYFPFDAQYASQLVFAEGAEPGFDLFLCAENPYSDWIGAQIRADVYGWVCPGNPECAAHLTTTDA